MNQLLHEKKALVKVLETNPRYRIFYRALQKYNLIHQLHRPEVTLFIPTNTSFLFNLAKLDKMGNVKIRDIF